MSGCLLAVISALTTYKQWWIERVREIRSSPNPERVKSTIFEGILNSTLPDEEKIDTRLASEAQLIVFAGEGTTGWTQSLRIRAKRIGG
jgi:hypothetical protein